MQKLTQATLLMALLRGVGVPCRLHGFTIYKNLQRGVVSAVAFPCAPENNIHSWGETEWEGAWINHEGFILAPPMWRNCKHRRWAGQHCARLRCAVWPVKNL